MNKLLKILLGIEFILILIIIALFSIDNQKIPTGYAVKENTGIETEFKAYTKAVCEEEKSEHKLCRDVLFVKCNGEEHFVDDKNNFTNCGDIKINLSDYKVNGSGVFKTRENQRF